MLVLFGVEGKVIIMEGYIENGYKAIVQPIEDMHLSCGVFYKELEYTLSRQQQPEDNKDGLKRSFIHGYGVAGWIGYDIDSKFKTIKVLNERNSD